jgi:hypothetical protein
MSSKIYINEDIGYVEAWEALAHLTDDWICCDNVSHETVMNMRDVIAELRNELAEYVALHSKVADELGTANHKLMQIEDLAKRESGLTPRAADECPTCAGLGFVNDNRGRRGVDCSDCNGSGIRR